MMVKVRRLASAAVVMAVMASLVNTSNLVSPAYAQALGLPTRTLNLKVLGARIPLDKAMPMGDPGVGIWAVRGTPLEAFRSARVYSEVGGRFYADRQALGVRLRIGRQRPHRFLTNAVTVLQLLQVLGVRLASSDAVKPGLGAFLIQDLRVRIIRVRRFQVTQTLDLPFTTVITYSDTLDPGESQVLTPGVPGRQEVTYVVTYRNGKETGRDTSAQTILVAPVNSVVAQGPAAAGGSETGEATWYDFCPQPGMYAAHKTLPYGTTVTVTNVDNGKSVTVVINDRGPYGPGRIIDLCPEAFTLIAPLGQGVANVRITW